MENVQDGQWDDVARGVLRARARHAHDVAVAVEARAARGARVDRRVHLDAELTAADPGQGDGLGRPVLPTGEGP